MATRRYDQTELWDRLRDLYNQKGHFHSAVRRNRYEIIDLNESKKTYVIEYESGNPKEIPIKDVYAIYVELYRLGEMSRKYLRDNMLSIVGTTRYTHAPGASIVAILPELDDQIYIEKGVIKVA